MFVMYVMGRASRIQLFVTLLDSDLFVAWAVEPALRPSAMTSKLAAKGEGVTLWTRHHQLHSGHLRRERSPALGTTQAGNGDMGTETNAPRKTP